MPTISSEVGEIELLFIYLRERALPLQEHISFPGYLSLHIWRVDYEPTATT